jgi:hypothetical protein
MSAGVWRNEALMQIIDELWGELPADVVIELAKVHPGIVDACKLIHEIVNHEPEQIDRSHCDEFRPHVAHEWVYMGEARHCDGSALSPEHHEGGLDLAGGGDLG